MALVGFTAQVDAAYLRSRVGTLARIVRDWTTDVDETFVQMTINSNALQTSLVGGAGTQMTQAEMDATMGVLFAMRNLQLVASGAQAQTPASNFLAAIEPACGLD